MPVATFAIAHSDVQAHFFPALSSFGAGTKPTSTAVGQMISAAAARLAAALAIEGVSADAISTDAAATYPVAYARCQSVIRQDAAIRVMEAQVGAGNVPTFWRSEVDAFYEQLSTYGYLALGDAPAPSQLSDGPRWHGGRADLDVGDDEDLSDLVPRFRAQDEQ